jgi:polyprenyl-phospho-N-acetylgalactosaminyl synthase
MATPIHKADVWVIIPAYNEGPMVGEVVRRVRACGFEQVLVVNDGSTDHTAIAAREAGARVLSHPINRGAGAVSQTGILFARREGIRYMIQMDADGQHHPEDLDRLMVRMAAGNCDILIGSRFMDKSGNIPAIRIIYNQISNVFTNWFCRSWYSDTQSGFRMLNRQAIEAIDLHIDGFGYCSEMIIQAEQRELQVAEVPISVSYTEYSMSKGQDLHTGIVTALNLLWKLVFYPKH